MENKPIMKSLSLKPFFAAVLSVWMLSGCTSDPLSPGIEFMPDMYRSIAVKPYEASSLFADSISSLVPVPGTISQGQFPNSEWTVNSSIYGFEDSPKGYDSAAIFLKNPLVFTQAHLDNGKELYGKFCVHCHGDAGAGDGSLVKNGKFPSPGSYSSKVGLNDGKMFHTMTYGKGLMGQHASQLSKSERWELVFYINTLLGKSGSGASDSTSVVSDTSKVVVADAKKEIKSAKK